MHLAARPVGNDRQSHRAAGDFLYLTAKQKGDLDSREQIKAKREVDNVVDGHYDYQQKRGLLNKKISDNDMPVMIIVRF